jgi:O-acetyl-ADP-ribose deacetylase (regulator of RNase III)
MDIELLRADVSSLKVDAIVNPAPAVHGAFGGADVGEAVVSSGGNVLCKFVIHAIMPRNGDGGEEAKLANALRAALKRAEELAIASVAVPPLPPAFGFEQERCTRVLLSSALAFRAQARSLQRVVFCAFSEAAYAALHHALEELSH